VVFAVGLTLALVGILPRWAAAAWVVMGAFALITELGAVFGLPGWLLNLSPLSHVPNLPAQDLAVAPLVWLTAIGAALAVAGYVAIQTRDVRN
jgi:ABC-2 type transport system permease protein